MVGQTGGGWFLMQSQHLVVKDVSDCCWRCSDRNFLGWFRISFFFVLFLLIPFSFRTKLYSHNQWLWNISLWFNDFQNKLIGDTYITQSEFGAFSANVSDVSFSLSAWAWLVHVLLYSVFVVWTMTTAVASRGIYYRANAARPRRATNRIRK